MRSRRRCAPLRGERARQSGKPLKLEDTARFIERNRRFWEGSLGQLGEYLKQVQAQSRPATRNQLNRPRRSKKCRATKSHQSRTYSSRLTPLRAELIIRRSFDAPRDLVIACDPSPSTSSADVARAFFGLE
jgi:hypothetical protein